MENNPTILNPYSNIDYTQLIVIEATLSDLLDHFRIVVNTYQLNPQYFLDYYSSISILPIFNDKLTTLPFKASNHIIILQSLKMQLISIAVVYNISIDHHYKQISNQSLNLLKNLIYEVHQNFLMFLQVLLNAMHNDSYSNVYCNKIQKTIYSKIIKRIGQGDLFSLIKKTNSTLCSNIKVILSNDKNNKDIIGIIIKKIDTITFDYLKQFLRKKIEVNQTLPSNQIINDKPSSLETLRIPYINHPIVQSKEMTIVLDLDETMISFKINNQSEKGMLKMRPGLIELLEDLQSKVEFISFTAATQDYADPIIDAIEQDDHFFSSRLYRQHTVLIATEYIKDLTLLGRDIQRMIIVDNAMSSFCLQKENGILIQSYNGVDDKALINLNDLIKEILKRGYVDIRKELKNLKDVILEKISEPGFETL